MPLLRRLLLPSAPLRRLPLAPSRAEAPAPQPGPRASAVSLRGVGAWVRAVVRQAIESAARIELLHLGMRHSRLQAVAAGLAEGARLAGSLIAAKVRRRRASRQTRTRVGVAAPLRRLGRRGTWWYWPGRGAAWASSSSGRRVSHPRSSTSSSSRRTLPCSRPRAT